MRVSRGADRVREIGPNRSSIRCVGDSEPERPQVHLLGGADLRLRRDCSEPRREIRGVGIEDRPDPSQGGAVPEHRQTLAERQPGDALPHEWSLSQEIDAVGRGNVPNEQGLPRQKVNT